MALDGSTTTFLPYTLNGLQEISADSQVVQTLQVNSLTPNRVVVSNSSDYLTSAAATSTEVDFLTGTTSNIQSQLNARATTSYVDTNFLNKTTSSDQTVAGKVTYTKELVVSPQKRTDLSQQVIVDSNYQNLITSASVSISQHFGTITNSGGVYQSTCTNNPQPALIVFSITSGNRYRFQIETLIEDNTYDWAVDIYQSQDNIYPYPNYNDGILDSKNFGPGSVVYLMSDVSFIANTTGSVVATISGNNPSGIGTLKWKNLKVYEMGVELTKVSMPSLTADRVAVINEKKQLVASGISTTKLGYLDNVSSDIQTQLNAKASTTYVDTQDNLRLLKAGDTMTGTLVMGSNKITTSYTPVNAEDLTRKGYVDSAISGAVAGYLPLSGGTLTGTVYNNAGNFQAYRGGDLNKSCTLYANNADGASYATHNGGLASWNGIGFYCTLDSTARHVFNTRDGSTQQTGKLTCVGMDTTDVIQSGLASNTTANIKFANSLSHIDNAAGEVYLFTGFQGHLAIGRNTTRDATTANLCLGVANTEESQIISTNTNNSGYLPLTFASSKFVFSSGNVGIGNTNPFGPLHFANAVANRKIVLYQTINNDHQYYGFGINGNTLRYQVDQSTSNHIFYSGNGTTSSVELMRIQGNGNVGIGTTNPTGHLTIYDTTSDYTNNVVLKQPWPGILLDNTQLSGGREWCIFSGGSGSGIGIGNFGIYDKTASAYRFSIDSNGQAKFHSWFRVDNGDVSTCVYGPNSTWNARLRVGAATSGFDATTAQIISTNGNLHLDPGYYKDTYIAYYQYIAGQNGTIRSYGPFSHTGSFTAGNSTFDNVKSTGYVQADGDVKGNEVYTNNWFRTYENNSGLYWQNLGTGICSAQGATNSYGHVSTYGVGRNAWSGYGLGSRYCFMKYAYGDEWGIHDNNYSWLIYGTGSTARDVKIGGGVAQFSRNYDRMLIFANGDNTGSGYAYYNQANTLGTISDRRIKKDFLRITETQSVEFLRALEPTSFCLKDSDDKKKTTQADGTEVEEVGCGVCTCRQDGWIAQNVLQACEVSGASKTVVNHWVEYEQELLKPEEERTTLIGVSDRPILSHTVNVVKHLLDRIDVLEQRNELLERHARQQEEEFNDYRGRTDSKIEKLAGLLKELIMERVKTY